MSFKIKMSGWMLSLVLASIIALLATMMESNDPKRDKMSYALKIFLVSFLVIYFGWMFACPDSDFQHEILTGEPPF